MVALVTEFAITRGGDYIDEYLKTIDRLETPE